MTRVKIIAHSTQHFADLQIAFVCVKERADKHIRMNDEWNHRNGCAKKTNVHHTNEQAPTWSYVTLIEDESRKKKKRSTLLFHVAKSGDIGVDANTAIRHKNEIIFCVSYVLLIVGRRFFPTPNIFSFFATE